jgi:hypothetical protein
VIIQVGSNKLDCNVEATIAAFQGYTPQPCECNGCCNFRAGQEAVFTEPILKFFSRRPALVPGFEWKIPRLLPEVWTP